MSENQRIEFGHLPVEERIKSFRDFTIPLNDDEVHAQSLRCLHCGTPFCSNNCPLHNRPVDWNRLVREGDWERAWACLSATNSFPEFTSRVCPAICEAGCTRYLLDDAAVGIRSIERAVIDRAWREGWVRPEPAAVRTGRRVAVVGSGPAGLACAQQLARAGHDVTVYEKSERPGGLLRFGIPGFKLEKDVVERRISQLEAEGVRFELSVVVGDRKFEAGVHNAAKRSVKAADLLGEYDAVVLACGSEVPRDLKVPGREGRGVFFALDVLQEQNRVDEGLVKKPAFDCRGCDVVIVGGGDTRSGQSLVVRAMSEGRRCARAVDVFLTGDSELPSFRP